MALEVFIEIRSLGWRRERKEKGKNEKKKINYNNYDLVYSEENTIQKEDQEQHRKKGEEDEREKKQEIRRR